MRRVKPVPQLVVFDWDGTLSDSSARIVTCFRRALDAVGVAKPVDDQTIRETIGLELADAAAVMMPSDDTERRLAMTQAYRDFWLAPGAPRANLFSDARTCLQAFADRGVTLAVATGKSRRGLDRELGETGIRGMFEATRTADETRGKPHPQMLNELLDHLDVPRERALMVGDTTFDLEMANAAGVRAVAIASGTHSLERLQTASPMACLANIGELVGLLLG